MFIIRVLRRTWLCHPGVHPDGATRHFQCLLLQPSTPSAAATAPDEYLCPITCEVMEDPVMADDGQTYERAAIATWVAGHGTSPMTRQPMDDRFLSIRGLKAAIVRWQQETDRQ